MLEIPESHTIAGQLSDTVTGKRIVSVLANSSPHGFAFFTGDPDSYDCMLSGKTVTGAGAYGGLVEIEAEDMRILMGDGANIRFLDNDKSIPKKHQLLIGFDDSTFLVCTIQMYGGIWAFEDGTNDNFYYTVAKQMPSPLTDGFDLGHFMTMYDRADRKISVKALLATEQRIPGLGNGCLHDILFASGINPKTQIDSLSHGDIETLFLNVKNVIKDMTYKGGRDVEKDLFGKPGGYRTILSSKTYGVPCIKCGSEIIRQSYLGGNVYYCPVCQPMTVRVIR